MKNIWFFLLLSFPFIFLSSCREPTQEYEESPSYVPETADMMNSILRFHHKLWLAGQHENWELADFELHELEEIFEMIEKYKSHKDYITLLPMINPPIENLETAIKSKNKKAFEEQFVQLTNTCNTCHKSTGHPYIVIQLPTDNPYSNQRFTIDD